mgnify:CR=1 FL=1
MTATPDAYAIMPIGIGMRANQLVGKLRKTLFASMPHDARLSVLVHDLRDRGGVDSREELCYTMRRMGRLWLLLRIWFAGCGVCNLPDVFNGRQLFVIEDVPVHVLAENDSRNHASIADIDALRVEVVFEFVAVLDNGISLPEVMRGRNDVAEDRNDCKCMWVGGVLLDLLESNAREPDSCLLYTSDAADE